ncbi:hypothetical protein HUU05_20095 [candidate division KSB1 bacterium]|nr:hypothetical protein [candidate division KSB1 bacterium]
MNIFHQALQQYSQGSNTRLFATFAILGGLDALVSYLYVYFIARHQQDSFLLSYLVPLLLLVIAAGFLIAGLRSKRGWEGLIFVVLAIFGFFAAVLSFVVTLLLLTFVY